MEPASYRSAVRPSQLKIGKAKARGGQIRNAQARSFQIGKAKARNFAIGKAEVRRFQISRAKARIVLFFSKRSLYQKRRARQSSQRSQ